MQYLAFSIHGMSCDGCANNATGALESLKSANYVEGAREPETAILPVDEAHLHGVKVATVIGARAYPAQLTHTGPGAQGLR